MPELTSDEPDKLHEYLERMVVGVEDNVILPAQFFEAHCSDFPREYILRYKCFRTGIREFFKFASATSKAGRKKFDDAERWIISRDRIWPYSFENLCEVFKLDPGRTRMRLLETKKAQQEARYQRAVKELRDEEAQEAPHQSPQPACSGGALPQGWPDERSSGAEEGVAQHHT